MASSERDPLLNEKFVLLETNMNDEKTHADIKSRTEKWRTASQVARTQSSRIHSILAAISVFGIATLVILGTLYYSTGSSGLPSSSLSRTSFTDQKPVNSHADGFSNYTCLPVQSCWPSTSEWVAFNRSIEGALKNTIPWAAPCYNGTSREECQDVAENYMDGVERTKQYGSMEFLDWETCGDENCFLNSFSPASPVSGKCSLGRLSAYHVEVRSLHAVSKTLEFVGQHKIRVSIKNSGHDYFGRSNAANSLAIWTHNMKNMHYHKTLTPKGCQSQYTDVGEVGAGVSAQEAWEFFEPLNMLVTVGAINSVGIAGGYGQGGGHGPFGPKWGLMVDNAIEFEVVTADGQARTINECTDPDLFWAMRGGGGGTYAILTSYKFQLHAAEPLNVYSFQARFPVPEGDLDITESKVHRDIITALALNQTLFSNHGIAGYNFILPDHMVSLHILPSDDPSAIKTITSQWHDFLTAYPGLNITDNTYHIFPKFSKWHDFTEIPSIARNGPVGLGIAESGRLIPRSLFSTPADISTLVSAVVTAMQFSYTNHGGGGAQIYATGPANQPDNSKTGLNPAWRDSLWEVILGEIWTSNTPLSIRTQIRNTISAAIQPLKALTPGGGCYMNEGDWTEENWRQTFFGSNYGKLLEVKRKYDPSGLFNCWKCVGWTGYQDPMYSCYTQSNRTPEPSIPLGPLV